MKVKILSLSIIVVYLFTMTVPGTSQVDAQVCFNFPLWNYGFGPAIACADNGDTIEMQGGGYYIGYTIPPYIVGGGSFVHKDPAGNVVRQGTWQAEKLEIFKFYGCDEEYNDVMGGRAIIKVRLVASDGSKFYGDLDLESLVGTPPHGALGGMRLSVKSLNLYFNQPISGSVYFSTI